MILRISIASLALVVLLTTNAQATILAYVTNPATQAVNPGPSNLDAVYGFPIETFFDIWVKTDVPVNGLSLDVLLTGGSTIQSAIVQNFSNGANQRWTQVFNGEVSADGKTATSLDGYALNPSPGMNPATKFNDAGYNAAADAFHFARVNIRHQIFGPAFTYFTDIKLRVGGNEIGVDNTEGSTVFFGVGDAAVCHTANFDCAGKVSTLIDGRYSIPEPGSVALAVLAVLGHCGFFKRHGNHSK